MNSLRTILWVLLSIIRPTVEADTSTVLRLLSSIKKQDDFNYLLLMKYQNVAVSEKFMANCFVRTLMEDLQAPVMQLDERVNYILYDRQSSRALSVLYLIGADIDDYERLLRALVVNLSHMTTSRVVFMLQLEEANETLLHKLFNICWQMKLLNVLAIFESFQFTSTFYSYSPFPSYQLEQRAFHSSSIIFPDRLRDLQGFSVRIAIGGAAPRIIVYYDRQGHIAYRGILGHFMHAFSQKYNCTLTQPMPARPNELLPSTQLSAAVRNDTVDISFAITYPIQLKMQPYSYPYELMNWCMMLPVEADIPRADCYLYVFELQAFVLTVVLLTIISALLSAVLRSEGYSVRLHEFILHESCVRGVLGQSVHQVRRASMHLSSIYLQISLLGFSITTWYNSYFSAYVTSIPKVPPYRGYDDIMASQLKVVVWEAEYEELLRFQPDIRQYESMFLIEPSFNKFMRMGDSFDTRYGFMTTTSKWLVINEQQMIFRKPLFRIRTDLCFFNNVPLGFPLHENSIYKDSITKLILQLEETGLKSHWSLKGFSELVEAGEMQYLDHSRRREFRAMKLDDLEYVLYGFGLMLVLSLVVFLLEVFVNWLRESRWHNYN